MTQFILNTASMLSPGLAPDVAAAIFLALTRPEVYRELVTMVGWTPEAYERWLAEALKSQLLP
jgi:hypothetical protein